MTDEQTPPEDMPRTETPTPRAGRARRRRLVGGGVLVCLIVGVVGVASLGGAGSTATAPSKATPAEPSVPSSVIKQLPAGWKSSPAVKRSATSGARNAGSTQGVYMGLKPVRGWTDKKPVWCDVVPGGAYGVILGTTKSTYYCQARFSDLPYGKNNTTFFLGRFSFATGTVTTTTKYTPGVPADCALQVAYYNNPASSVGMFATKQPITYPKPNTVYFMSFGDTVSLCGR